MKNIPWYKISYLGGISSALIILIMGIYFSVVSSMQIGNESLLYKIKSDKTIPTEQLIKLIDRQRRAASISKDGIVYQDLGLAELDLAKRYGYQSEKGSELLKNALSNLEIGVELKPARSIGWMRLAYARMLSSGPSEDVSNAIYMSVIAAPYHYKVLYYRLGMAIIVWKYFSDEAKDLLLHQVRIGWERDKRFILQLAKSSRGKEVILSALSDSNYDIEEVERLVNNVK